MATGLVRQALGAHQLPPGQVLIGLSLFLTILVMSPTWEKINRDALGPYLSGAPGVTQRQALKIAAGHLRDFMYQQISQAGNDADILMFLEYCRGRPVRPDETIRVGDVPLRVMIPAFILSELKTAFVMGFRIYLPFLVIDMVIASILISMGMLMLPPVLISLPFKLLLFVLADGWNLVVRSVVESFY